MSTNFYKSQLDTVLLNLIKHQRFGYEDIFGLRLGWICI